MCVHMCVLQNMQVYRYLGGCISIVRTDIVEVQDSQKQWVGRQRTATIPLDRRKQKRRRFVIFR